ncbi:MAG: beta-ketoacyl-ACP synthase III [Candidatus Obscuribacter sp.]|nr:beta-ketoacyl-ACP synthase III [Candidatus Obscuribacter sp.]
MRQVRIVGTGKYLPQTKVTSSMVAARFGLDASQVEERSGIKSRHRVKGETASEMAALAAQDALSAAGLKISDIDCIVCTSGCPEQSFPCTASLVQNRLGAGDSGIPAFDINASCLSFLTGLDTLSYMIEASRYRRVLLIASEVCTGVNWDDYETGTLFGDGAAAAVVEKCQANDTSAILASRMETYGKGATLSQCLAGGNKYLLEEYKSDPTSFLFTMDGKGLYKMAAQMLPGLVQQLLSDSKLTVNDIDLVIPHQASLSALELTRRNLGFTQAKWMNILENHGNTIAASIPMALHEAIVQKKLVRGQLALLLGTAAGFSVGGLLFRY